MLALMLYCRRGRGRCASAATSTGTYVAARRAEMLVAAVVGTKKQSLQTADKALHARRPNAGGGPSGPRYQIDGRPFSLATLARLAQSAAKTRRPRHPGALRPSGPPALTPLPRFARAPMKNFARSPWRRSEALRRRSISDGPARNPTRRIRSGYTAYWGGARPLARGQTVARPRGERALTGRLMGTFYPTAAVQRV